MFQALNVINLENVFVNRSTVVLKKDANFFTCFDKLLPFFFNSRHGSTESFILVVSPLLMRDQTNDLWPSAGNCWKIKEVIGLRRCETQYESCRN